MRISTSQIHRQGSDAIVEHQAGLAQQQLRLASGRRTLSPSEDPAAAVQSLALRSATDATRQYQRNGDLAEARLGASETVLTAVSDNLQRVRELTLQAANASQTDATRGDIASEIEQRLAELLDLANTRDANGEYLYAGFQSGQRPFTRSSEGIRYDGDDGQRFVALGQDRQVAVGDSGRDLFVDVPAGNGTFDVAVAAGNTGSGVIETGSVTDPGAFDQGSWRIEFTAADRFAVRDGSGALIAIDQPWVSDAAIGAIPGIEVVIEGAPAAGDAFVIEPAGRRDLFTVYQQLVDTLRTSSAGEAAGARFQTGMNRALTALDGGLGHIQDARARLGARLSGIDNQRSVNEATLLQLESTRSKLEDLDFVTAISQFQQQLSSLEAARASFARIQGMSLFDFLR